MKINTGQLTKNLRRQKAELAKPKGFSIAPKKSSIAMLAAKPFGALAFGAGHVLTAVSWVHYFLGYRLAYFLASTARKFLPLPAWLPTTPAPARSLRQKASTGKPKVVVFHPCGSRLMGGKSNFDKTRDDLTVVTERVLARLDTKWCTPRGWMACAVAWHSTAKDSLRRTTGRHGWDVRRQPRRQVACVV